MTLRELRYLVAVADHGHFGRAAAACHVSQPTLSTQLRKLEGYLGVTLFERTNKAVHATPVGARVVARARRVLAEADALVETAREASDALAGPLNLGLIPTLSPYALPWMLPALRADFPALHPVVHEDLTAALLARLAAHRLDAAMVALPVAADDLEVAPLFDEPFFLACPHAHALAAGGSAVRQADLEGERLLLLTEGHCLRDQALAVCGFADAPSAGDDADFRATSLETIRQMVASGAGCTLLPAMAIDGEVGEAFAVRPLADGAARRIALVWRRSYPKAADLRRLAETIRRHAPDGVRALPAGAEPDAAESGAAE